MIMHEWQAQSSVTLGQGPVGSDCMEDGQKHIFHFLCDFVEFWTRFNAIRWFAYLVIRSFGDYSLIWFKIRLFCSIFACLVNEWSKNVENMMHWIIYTFAYLFAYSVFVSLIRWISEKNIKNTMRKTFSCSLIRWFPWLIQWFAHSVALNKLKSEVVGCAPPTQPGIFANLLHWCTALQ